MKKYLVLQSLMIVCSTAAFCQYGNIATIAGTGVNGYSGDGGPATLAAIRPTQIIYDNSGNLFFTDNSHAVIRKINTSGIISTVAGTGTSGYSGDGGPATAALINMPVGIVIDATGNIFFAEEGNNIVRKINTAGIISTYAGTGTSGFSGDGGPASAAKLHTPLGMAIDASGNLYVADGNNYVIRKISTTGIISTIAGNYALGWGFSGDGGPATAAQMTGPNYLAVDLSNNLYIGDNGNARIRKVNAAGIISTFAGNGIASYTGDNGPATAASLDQPGGIYADLGGNIIFSDQMNNRIRKIDNFGIIRTIAGNGVGGYSGDSGPATAAELSGPSGIALDPNYNLVIADLANSRIRKVTTTPVIATSNFKVFLDKRCYGIQLTIIANSPSSLSMKVSYSDGASFSGPMIAGSGTTKYLDLTHTYANPGNYTLKFVLYSGATAIDSAKYSCQYQLCSSVAVNNFLDGNSNCLRETSEGLIQLPLLFGVDSNGHRIDTIPATSGFYYNAFGNAGDIYKFNLLSAPAGLMNSCGAISDTLLAHDNSVTRDMGFSCSPSSSFDLAVFTSQINGRHWAGGTISVNNNYCTPEAATVSLQISPKYIFDHASIAPSSVIGNTVTWNLSSVSAAVAQPAIQYSLTIPGTTYLIPGDTAMNNYAVTPISGDTNPGNNNQTRTDTIKSSYDPNEMAVTPSGYITAGTQLQYTINFENTGNDTAYNIYVMDTLSDNVDVHSLKVLATSVPVMNTYMSKSGGHNIVKFDFPNINLLDSSHHNLCDGMVLFSISTKSGLPNGTTIFNQAGIYFDDNPVVMTNTVEDIIGIPVLHTAAVNANAFSIFPNPANSILTVNTELGAFASFTITNNVGQLMARGNFTSQHTNIDIASLPAGVYYITLTGSNDTRMQKFIKM